MCTYEVYNSRPAHTLYLNVYRKTNNSDIGIYYQKSAQASGDAAAKKSPYVPKDVKRSIRDYIPGQWVNASIPVETEDHKNLFHTFKV